MIGKNLLVNFDPGIEKRTVLHINRLTVSKRLYSPAEARLRGRLRALIIKKCLRHLP